MNKSKISIVCFMVFSSITAIADSAQEAEKISQMVNLVSSGVYCGGSGFYEYTIKINADGSRSTFSIPQDYALVVTSSESTVVIEGPGGVETIISQPLGSISDVVIFPGVRICGAGGNIHGHLERRR